MQRKIIDLSKNVLFWLKQKSLENILCHSCQTMKRVKKATSGNMVTKVIFF